MLVVVVHEYCVELYWVVRVVLCLVVSCYDVSPLLVIPIEN